MTTAFVCMDSHREFLKVRHHSKSLGELLQLTWCPKEETLLQMMAAPLCSEPAIIIWEPSAQINAVAMTGAYETLIERSLLLAEASRNPALHLLVLGTSQTDSTLAETYIAAGASVFFSRSGFTPEDFLRQLRQLTHQCLVMAAKSRDSGAGGSTDLSAQACDTTLEESYETLLPPQPSTDVVAQRSQLSSAVGHDVVLSYDEFLQHIDAALDHYDESGFETCAVLCLNINNFRRLAQMLGKTQARAFMRALSRQLSSTLLASHAIAVLGGDEIGIFVCGTDDESTHLGAIRQIFSAVDEGIAFEGQQLALTVAIGVAMASSADRAAEELLSNASIAMARAKLMPGNSWTVYSAAFKDAVRSQLQLENQFRAALRSDELEVYYQPKIELASGLVRSVEALVRWRHRERGLLLPGEFISMAESSGMIVPMGYRIIEKVCEDLQVLQRMGHTDLRCAINLSFRQFYDRKLAETVFRIIFNANIPTSNIEFELTESAMMFDTDFTIKSLQELRKLGLRFALDDFGTGYASFNNLRRLPISTVKIDQAFIASMNDISEDATLVEGMIKLSHGLGLTVVAEGVETRAQIEFLHRVGCDEAQGNIIAPALPFDALCAFMDAAASVADERSSRGNNGNRHH